MVDHWHLSEPDSAHALPVEQLKSIVERYTNASNSIQCFNSVSEAYDDAMCNMKNGDRLLAFGSTMTVAEALKS